MFLLKCVHIEETSMYRYINLVQSYGEDRLGVINPPQYLSTTPFIDSESI